MKILVDTNRIIAALSKKGTTREIFFDSFFEFVTPDYTYHEIEKHKQELKNKTKLNEEEFELLLGIFFGRIIIIPELEFKHLLKECKEDISDPSDIAHLAAALAVKAEGLWSHDPHFLEQKKIRVFTNIDLLTLSGKKRL